MASCLVLKTVEKILMGLEKVEMKAEMKAAMKAWKIMMALLMVVMKVE